MKAEIFYFQTSTSCPVDRKQFQAVCKLNALEDCIKVSDKLYIIHDFAYKMTVNLLSAFI